MEDAQGGMQEDAGHEDTRVIYAILSYLSILVFISIFISLLHFIGTVSFMIDSQFIRSIN